ncbi:ATP-grasp domain-containing protein [Treponema primitia]|uniref:ATP-grasp domain-containing protein n=1 Tax=Treponema primitia TaxID=88058 RepID=UPI0002554EEA|nr:ATP-grasp domain-containing protein [Treponema primitia]
MENKLQGKKLLVLGDKHITSYDIVAYARSKGVYTIVTDYLPIDKSLAKQIADEYWNISTAEVDTLVQLAKENHIDGVFAGVPDFNIYRAMEICERLGLPFYATREQLEITTDKSLFKKTCRKYNVPVAEDYSDYYPENCDKIAYPVIVKPEDSHSARGISICNNYEELKIASEFALSNSQKKGNVVIEQFIKGDQIAVRYSIADGIYKISSVTDFYLDIPKNGEPPIPYLLFCPSKYIDRYIRECHTNVSEMFKELGVKNGFFWFQIMVNDSGFYFVDPAYRFSGGASYKFTKSFNGISHLEMMVNYALTGEMGDDIKLENPYFKKIGYQFNIISSGGVIDKIIGYEEAKKYPFVIDSDKQYDIGDCIPKRSGIHSIVSRFYLAADTIKEMQKAIHDIQGTIKVLDKYGKNILIEPFDVSKLK